MSREAPFRVASEGPDRGLRASCSSRLRSPVGQKRATLSPTRTRRPCRFTPEAARRGEEVRPMPKVYLHERSTEYRCQAGLAEHDTMSPHEVRHECDKLDEHDGSHVCTCGLVLDDA
jgi:hypothetical protein